MWHLEHTRAGPTTKCTSLEVVPTDSSLRKKTILVKSAPHSKVPWSARGLGEKKTKKTNKKEVEIWRERHRIINYPTGYFKYPRKYFSYCWLCPTTVYKRLRNLKKYCARNMLPKNRGGVGGWTVTFLLDLLKAFINRGWADSRMWNSFSRRIKISDRIFKYPRFSRQKNVRFLCRIK